MAKHKVGDTVRVKSGGPNLTVVGVRKRKLDVTYFDEAERRFIRESFPIEALAPVETKKDTKTESLAQA